ncbi:MAG: hypothetical protein RLZZ241_2364 [Bacteroidota bacterium]|jgi:hypothetical protein
MKSLFRIALVVLFFGSISEITAQDADNPWLITVGINAVDVYPTNSDNATQLPSYETGKLLSEFFSISDHWNIVPSITYMQISKYVGDGLSFGVRGSVNNISKLGNTNSGGLAYYGLDGILKYNITDGKPLQPFVEIGGGYYWVDGVGAGTANTGAGLNYWINDSFGVSLQTLYKLAFETYGMTHFQHSAGLTIRL